MILDWMMPEMDGIEALRQMRAEGISAPCLLLTARDAVEDRVAGLDAGADDYLPKPFNAQELLARVRAMLRRRDAYVPDVVSFGDLSLDKGTGELQCEGRTVRLAGKMLQMMTLFMENPHVLFSVQQLMDKVWGWDTDAEINVVWVNISHLRKSWPSWAPPWRSGCTAARVIRWRESMIRELQRRFIRIALIALTAPWCWSPRSSTWSTGSASGGS